jgi:hypothetical protein
MRKASIILGCVMGIVIAHSTWASQVPIWRTDPPGKEPTTYQMWTFEDDDNPAAPEVDENLFGTAEALIVASGDIHGYDPGWYAEYLGREGIWHAERLEITLTIPNTPTPAVVPNWKEVWVEVGFRGEFVQYQVNPPADLIDSSIINTGQGWRTLYVGWKIEPNPTEEEIYMVLMDSGADVDYIVADTICIPEPTTLLLLGLGAVLLRRKR